MRSIQAELKAINDEVKVTMRAMQDNLAHITQALQSDIVSGALAAAEGACPPLTHTSHNKKHGTIVICLT